MKMVQFPKASWRSLYHQIGAAIRVVDGTNCG